MEINMTAQAAPTCIETLEGTVTFPPYTGWHSAGCASAGVNYCPRFMGEGLLFPEPVENHQIVLNGVAYHVETPDQDKDREEFHGDPDFDGSFETRAVLRRV